MIPKVKRGKTMGGLLTYLVEVDPERTANVHQSPHLVAGCPSVEAWFPTGVLSHADGLAIARELDKPRKLFGVDVPDGHVWHTSLSLKAGEAPLSDERWGQIAREFMRLMEFDDPDSPRAPVRWAAVEHGASRAGNAHIHIAASLVREDGTKANPFRDYKRAQDACRALERKFGLVELESRSAGLGRRGVSRAELEIATRQGRAEPVRRTVERRVRAAAAQAGGEAEFVGLLRGQQGLRVFPWYGKGGTERVAGYAVALPGEGQRKWGGGTLAPDLTLPRLRQAYGWADAEQAVPAWKSSRAVSPRGPQAGADPAVWAAAAADVQAMVGYLAGVPIEDTAAWAVAATDVAGVFAAWSTAVEGDRPGPLARAGDALARSGEISAHAASPRPVGMPSTRSGARLVASAARGGQGSVAEAALLLQLRNAAKAVHDMHAARAQAQHAAALAVATRDGLAPLLPAPTPAQGPGMATAVLERPRTVRRPEKGRGR